MGIGTGEPQPTHYQHEADMAGGQALAELIDINAPMTPARAVARIALNIRLDDDPSTPHVDINEGVPIVYAVIDYKGRE